VGLWHRRAAAAAATFAVAATAASLAAAIVAIADGDIDLDSLSRKTESHLPVLLLASRILMPSPSAILSQLSFVTTFGVIDELIANTRGLKATSAGLLHFSFTGGMLCRICPDLVLHKDSELLKDGVPMLVLMQELLLPL